jgi:transcriptional regulator of aromatic amino acid metabolism
MTKVERSCGLCLFRDRIVHHGVEHLSYPLNVFPIEVPSLRARPKDLPMHVAQPMMLEADMSPVMHPRKVGSGTKDRA